MNPKETHLIWNIPRKKPGPKIKPFDPFVADFIYEQISYGKSLDAICAMPGVPGRWIIRRWRKENPEFNKALAQARSDRSIWISEEVYIRLLTQRKTSCKRGSWVAYYKWLSKVRSDYKTFGFSTKGVVTKVLTQLQKLEIANSFEALWAAPISCISQKEE